MLVTHRRDRVQLLLPLIIVDCQPPIITIKPVSRAPFSSLFRNARSVVRTKRHDKFALFRLITIRFTFFHVDRRRVRRTGQDFVNIFTLFRSRLSAINFFPHSFLLSLSLSLSLSSPTRPQRFASHDAPERTNEVKYGSLVETNERPPKRYFHYLANK